MNLKKLILFFLSVFFCGYDLKAQDAIQNKLSPEEYNPSRVELKKFTPAAHKFIFIDEREDTTRMGFLLGSNRQYYFTFPKPAPIYLEEKMNSKIGEFIDTLYIGIKRLWISQLYKPSSLVKAILVNWNTTIGYCRVNFNFYKKVNDSYYLLHTYDSIVSKNGYLGNIKDNLLEENLSAMKVVADSIGNLQGPFTTSYSPDIKMMKPILSAHKPADGIYLKFEDFINNKPVSLPFTYSVSKTGEKLILNDKRSDDSVYTEQCWGFCKNNIPYVRIGSRFSKLTKIENTFELRIVEFQDNRYSKEGDAFWLGFSIARSLSSGFPIFALADILSHKGSPEKILRVSPFKLDMETGNVY